MQDTPIFMLPPPDHQSPTHCVTHTVTHTALLSHTLHLSPNRGSRGASAVVETGVGKSTFTIREQIISAIILCLIIDRHKRDDHMGVCSTLTTNEFKKDETQTSNYMQMHIFEVAIFGVFAAS